MNASPQVSVLVTVYNREKYLAACIESILSSTFDDFEVVIVDDRSADSSLSIAQGFASRDARVTVTQNEKNLGDYPNRMRAAELAGGKYIKYVDSDDLIYSHSLDVMVDAMDANADSALGLSYSLPEAERPYPWKLSPREAWVREFLGVGAMGCGPSGTIMRRDRFFEAGGFGNWGVLSDTDMWLRMSARWPIVLLPPGLVWWRRHDNQEFTRNDAQTTYLENGFKLRLRTLEGADSPLTAEETKSAIARLRQHHARRLLALAVVKGKPAEALRMMKESGLSTSEIIAGFSKYQ